MNKNAWRESVVATARLFADMIWTPTEINLYHGNDVNGVLVNTPDINYTSAKFGKCGWWRVGESNKGMAYNWGGLCTVDEYQNAIAKGSYAGNVPDSRNSKRSRQCVGVDCSGLVSVCWGLEKKFSTKDLLSVSTKLDNMGNLLPGDIVLLPGSHVMIFVKFADDAKLSAEVIDATRSTGKVSLRTVELDELARAGFAGYFNDCENIWSPPL